MKTVKDYIFPRLNPNVSPSERIVSVLAGSFLFYNSLTKSRKNIPEAILAGYLFFRGTTGYCFFYKALGKTKPDNRSRNVNIQLNFKVNKPREEVYNFWRELENLPLFMGHLESVKRLNNDISEWNAKIPGGMGNIRWKSEIVKERPNEFLGWHSLPGSGIENAGKVEFKDAKDSGTNLHVVITYHAPMGIAGEGVARMFNPYFKEIVEEDVKNFKKYIENKGVKTTPGKFLV